MTPPGDERQGDTVSEAIITLSDAGYLVVKIPPCKFTGAGHGRHGLVTRTAMCEGEGPVPHGFKGTHLGPLGYWNHCSCGRDFQDFPCADSDVTPWVDHCKQHGLTVR